MLHSHSRRFVDQDKTRGCERDERVVFQVIERAGNKGIWIRDIRIFSGLVLAQLNKVLKSLEGILCNLIQPCMMFPSSHRFCLPSSRRAWLSTVT